MINKDLEQYMAREVLLNTLIMEKRFYETNDGVSAMGFNEKLSNTYTTGDPTGSIALTNIDKVKELDSKIKRLRLKQDRIKHYLSILTAEEYKIIELKYLNPERLTWQELAAKIPCSYGTARSKYFKAMEKLNELEKNISIGGLE